MGTVLPAFLVHEIIKIDQEDHPRGSIFFYHIEHKRWCSNHIYDICVKNKKSFLASFVFTPL